MGVFANFLLTTILILDATQILNVSGSFFFSLRNSRIKWFHRVKSLESFNIIGTVHILIQTDILNLIDGYLALRDQSDFFTPLLNRNTGSSRSFSTTSWPQLHTACSCIPRTATAMKLNLKWDKPRSPFPTWLDFQPLLSAPVKRVLQTCMHPFWPPMILNRNTVF